jgi:pyruvate dehydrogenase E1 component alpha subunit
MPPIAPDRDLAGYDAEFLLSMYQRMFLIRTFELRVNELFLRGLIPGTIHLSHGQEASTVGACSALRPDDMITMTHRAHGQALAKGVSADALMAELLGRVDGCSGGKGGSLHVGDLSVGALTASAIVAAAVPIATGLGYAFKRMGTDRVALAFMGDGAANKGDLHEALNLAAIWALPVVFLCENNFYASTTNANTTMLNDHVAERAAAYRMPAVTIYGNDPIEVHETVRTAVERARSGAGPTFVECLTYRMGGHKRDDPAVYRPTQEVQAWLARDPVTAFRARLADAAAIGPQEPEAREQVARSEVEHAVEFAMASPYPPLEAAVEHVHA